MFEKKKNYRSFVLTFLAGVFSGGAIALLFTPMTGKKMQKRVADVADRVIDKVEDLRKFATA